MPIQPRARTAMAPAIHLDSEIFFAILSYLPGAAGSAAVAAGLSEAGAAAVPGVTRPAAVTGGWLTSPRRAVRAAGVTAGAELPNELRTKVRTAAICSSV